MKLAKTRIIVVILLLFTAVSGRGEVGNSNLPVNKNREKGSGLKAVPPDASQIPSRVTSKARKIDPKAQPIIDEVQKSYEKLQSADLSGDFTISVNTTGVVHTIERPFTSSFERPYKFRHQMKPNVLLGSDGRGGYAYDQKENAYLRFKYPNTNQFRLKMPTGVMSTLLLQNPSLLFALSDVAILDAMEGFGDVQRMEDKKIGATMCQVLQFGEPNDSNSVLIAFDPTTHLIRQFTLKIKSEFAHGGNVVPGNAAIVVNYKSINSGSPHAVGHFAWSPPPGAQDMLEAAGAEK